MKFNDGIREYYGNYIVRCWRYNIMMLASKANGRTNSIKALNLLHYTVTENGYTIERTVNVHGRPGKNV